MYGDDWRYAGSRLNQTVVRLNDGTPILVREVMGVNEVGYENLLTGDVHLTGLSNINVKPSPLGFVNHRGVSSFIARRPMRNDWRQGFRHNNLVSLAGNSHRDIPYHVIAKTMVGDFPSMAECIKNSSDGTSSAWCRHWSVQGGATLLYKGLGPVGKFVEGQPILDEEHSYLEQYLRECA